VATHTNRAPHTHWQTKDFDSNTAQRHKLLRLTGFAGSCEWSTESVVKARLLVGQKEYSLLQILFPLSWLVTT